MKKQIIILNKLIITNNHNSNNNNNLINKIIKNIKINIWTINTKINTIIIIKMGLEVHKCIILWTAILIISITLIIKFIINKCISNNTKINYLIKWCKWINKCINNNNNNSSMHNNIKWIIEIKFFILKQIIKIILTLIKNQKEINKINKKKINNKNKNKMKTK